MTKTLDSTAVYAYTTLISVLICVPWALVAEGGTLVEGCKAAIAKVGASRFYTDLLLVGILYHLYNQVRAGSGGCAGSGVHAQMRDWG
jgi:solute carrier family 35 protein E1